MAERRPYAAHELLVGPARAHGTLWRLIAGLVLIAAVAYGLNSVLQAVLIRFAPEFWMTQLAGPGPQGATAASLLVILYGFGFVTIGVMVAARVLYHRPALGLFGPARLTLHQFWRVLRLLVLLSALVLILPPYDMGPPLEVNLEPRLWLLLLPLSLTAVLIQVSAEELLFRGFLQQGLAARFSHPLIWAGVPSLLFAAGHYLPGQAGDNALLVVIWAGLFGLLMADLTARAGSLGPAIAVHFLNNATSLLIVSVPDSLNGLSLYTAPFSMSDTGDMRAWLAVDFAAMLVGWLAARLAIRR